MTMESEQMMQTIARFWSTLNATVDLDQNAIMKYPSQGKPASHDLTLKAHQAFLGSEVDELKHSFLAYSVFLGETTALKSKIVMRKEDASVRQRSGGNWNEA